jgi:AcrR family transcriptional regulator
VDDIMKAAAMAKGSFYRYFSDQAGLMEELMAPVHGLLSAALDRCARELDGARSPEAQLAACQRVAAALSALLAQHPGEVRLYLQECRAPGQGTRRPVAELARLVARRATEIAVRAQAHRLLRGPNPALSALAVVGATERLLLARLHHEDLGGVEDVAPAVLSALLQGLGR